MLRAAMAAGTDLGLSVQPIYDRGDLVPDELMVALIRERLGETDTASGFVLDGFPRTLPQAEALDAMLGELGRGLSCVLEFQLDTEEAVRRMVGRAEQEQRSDDTPETIRHRLEVHTQKAEQLAAYYLVRGILVGIDARGSVEEVHHEVAKVIRQVEQRAST
jgi:adenylate kinase